MVSSVKTPRAAGLVGYGPGTTDEAALPAPPTQARGLEKRERIFEAAIRRFGSEGVVSTRVEDVISDAEVSWATFFRYFPRKGDVLIELAVRHFRGPVTTAADEAAAERGLPVHAAIERVFSALLVPAPGGVSAALHNAALLEVFAHPARFAALVGEGHPQPVVGLVAEILAEGQKRGELRADLDPGGAALTTVAGALFPAVQAASFGADPHAPLAGALDLLWGGLEQDRQKGDD